MYVNDMSFRVSIVPHESLPVVSYLSDETALFDFDVE